jgi:hypothetical protein
VDTKFKGNVTELEVLTYITRLGYQVSIPFGDRERYDQIWDIRGKLIKVQVKTASPIDDDVTAIKFSCRSSQRSMGKTKNSRYLPGEIDYFATFWQGRCYLIPLSETSTEKILRFHPPKNGQTKGITFANEYEVEVMLASI